MHTFGCQGSHLTIKEGRTRKNSYFKFTGNEGTHQHLLCFVLTSVLIYTLSFKSEKDGEFDPL